MTEWTKANWRAKPRVQMPDYTDAERLSAVEARLASYPPLVFAGEARKLRSKLAAAGRGEAFCCRAATAPRALRLSMPTTSATPSR